MRGLGPDRGRDNPTSSTVPRGASVAAMDPLRVLVAEDQALLRAGLVGILEKCRDRGRRAGRRRHRPAAQGPRAQARRRRHRRADAARPHRRRAARRRRRSAASCRDTGVLVLSQFLEESYALDLVGEDAGGRRLPAQGPRRRRRDVHRVGAARRRAAARRWTRASSRSMLGRRRKDDPLDALSPRERDVLSHMAEGLSNQGIAAGAVRHAGRRREARHGIFSKLELGHEPDRAPPRARGAQAPTRRLTAPRAGSSRARSCPPPGGLTQLERSPPNAATRSRRPPQAAARQRVARRRGRRR